MKYPVSMIPYANMAPYRQLGEPEGCEWVHLTPRRSSIALREGRVWAAAAPVGDLPALEECCDTTGAFGIAAAGAVRSVLLFSKKPLGELTAPARVKLTDHSSSSVRLLYLLLGYRHGFDCIPARACGGDADAELLIGDAALRRAEKPDAPFVTDLAAEWVREHGLPFVFARWVIRRDAPPELGASLAAWLEELRERDDELVQACAPAEAQRVGISAGAMISYLHGMKRVLGPDELAGQALFLKELERVPPVESVWGEGQA